jgi:adenylate cyclase
MSAARSGFVRWFGELRRRKVVRVAVAYLLLAWLVIQVADAVFEPLGLPVWALKLVIVLAALCFPVACGLAWAFDMTPTGVERTPPLALTEVAAATAASEPSRGAAEVPAQPSVAILPFLDLSPGRDQEYFCEGIAEEIINSLCFVRGLRVASRTSSFQFKDRRTDVREIGRNLGVTAVLEGSVRKSGDRVRITAQLINAADGYHHWSESFDRRLDDVFEIQSEIARQLVRALSLTLTPQENALLGRGGTANAAAYDLYLRGQSALREGTDTSLPQAVQLFREAIQRDPEFAQAHAGLAHALAFKGLWRLDMTESEFEEAFRASRRSLDLQPHMPEAYVASACLLSMQGRADASAQAFEAALRLNPASYDANYMYARHCFAQGQPQQAIRLFEAAHRLRPDDYQTLSMLEGALEQAGRSTEARAIGVRVMALIDARLAVNPDDDRALHLGAVQAAKLGAVERVRELADRALRLRPSGFATAYNLACAFAVLGERERAIELIETAVRYGRGNLGWIEHDPDLAILRGDPRFETVIDRLRTSAPPAQGHG